MIIMNSVKRGGGMRENNERSAHENEKLKNEDKPNPGGGSKDQKPKIIRDKAVRVGRKGIIRSITTREREGVEWRESGGERYSGNDTTTTSSSPPLLRRVKFHLPDIRFLPPLPLPLLLPL